MPRHLTVAALTCITLSACGRPAPMPQRAQSANTAATTSAVATAADLPSNSAPAALADDFAIGVPIRYANLTVFPVVSKTTRAADRFITLDEGLKSGTVEIRELGAMPDAENDDQPSELEIAGLQFDANDVNKLVVINRGEKPLYLMPGEIIVGGSQDRTFGEELVIAPTGKPVTIDVFCVEQGRWGLRDFDTATALYPALADSAGVEALAGEANEGRFVGKAGNLGKSGRLAVQADKDQGKVWHEVAKANAESGVSWASGAFTANYVDSQVVERLKPYQAAIDKEIAQRERVVGVVVAINGKIETADVFESTPLFLKLWPQLLKGYAFDAVEVRDVEEAANSSTQVAAEAFLVSILRDQDSATQNTQGGLIVSRHETSDRISFSAGAGMFGGMGGGMGTAAPVHAAGFSK